MNLKKEALDLHRKLKGKISVESKVRMNAKNLALSYTPGVGSVSSEIFKKKKLVYDYTMKGNSVGVVSDGSAVLGLGNIGAEAALPVMEGKCVLFKEFAGIDAFPICLRTQKVDEIVSIVRNLAPTFGGINLEDISAPRCFEIEERLQGIGIPVMHDDQHGTAIVVYAGLLNACKVVGKNFGELKVVVNGTGAAGTAISKLLACEGYRGNLCKSVRELIVLDSKGAIYEGREGLNDYKKLLGSITNRKKVRGNLGEVIDGADVFIGVSKAGLLTEGMVKSMRENAVVFALANPIPEIMPDKAKKAGAKVIATGRSDFLNQINNALAFPGVFRGLLDGGVGRVSVEMKLHAAYALAGTIKKPQSDKILPSIFDKNIVRNVAKAVREC